MSDVTIIVATHDRPAWLETALHSILASAATVKPRGVDTHVLVVDDCSKTTAARVIADRLGTGYMRLFPCRGMAEARMAGLAEVDSPLFAFWDDDDFMLPFWFEAHLERMALGADVVSSSYWFTDEFLRPTLQQTLKPVALLDLLEGRVAANDQSLIRRSALEGIRWRPERGTVMMMSLWLALAHVGRKFETIAEPCWLYRRHAGNMSAALDERDAALRLEAIAEYLPA
jgi:glycosyltransferase involved in cell wall biosynthesis